MRLSLFFVLISLICLTTSCADVNSPEAPPQEPVIVEIQIKDFSFIPQTVTIKAGTTVRWVNTEKRQYHTVWFRALGLAESDYLFPDDTFEMTFRDKGDFNYLCGPHPRMTGRIIVE